MRTLNSKEVQLGPNVHQSRGAATASIPIIRRIFQMNLVESNCNVLQYLCNVECSGIRYNYKQVLLTRYHTLYVLLVSEVSDDL